MRHRVLRLLVLAGCGVIVGGLAGCESPERPPHDLSDSAFVEVLLDLHLADARANATDASADSLRSVALERHGLDTLAFGELMRYYARHPEPYLAHYDEALDRLLREQRGPRTSPDTL